MSNDVPHYVDIPPSISSVLGLGWDDADLASTTPPGETRERRETTEPPRPLEETRERDETTEPPRPLEETRERRDSKQRAAGFWAESVSGTQLDEQRFDPLAYLIDPFLIVGGLTLLAAPPKSFKSLFALSCSLGVAAGGKALGKVDAKQGRVLYISLDDQSLARAQRRCRDHLGPGEAIPPPFTLHTKPNLGEGKKAARNLDAYLTAHPDCRLIVIDTLEHLREDRSSSDGPYRADVKALASLRWVLDRHPEVAILALLHTRKGEDDDAVTAVGGTHGVTGGADAVLRLSGRRGSPRRMLEVVSRDGDDVRRIVQVTKGGLVLTDEDPDDPSVLLTPDDQALYRSLAQFPDGASAVDLGQAHPTIQNIGNRLARLARDGYLARRGRGVYAVA